MTRIAIDTGALLALASTRDQYHARAVAAEARVRAMGGRWVASTLVLAELHGHLIRRADVHRARSIVVGLLRDAAFEWHDATAALVAGAVERWMVRFADQRFSLTDAVTFELMRQERLTVAFAFDQDFVTAGYALLS